ncbi:prophage PssSM-03, partial [Pseudomonas coronafaciens]
MKALPWKAVGLLLILLALAGALYGAYLHGVSVTDLAWKAKWAEEVSTQSEAVATTTTEYRTEEQRRQKAANQVANDARQNQTAALADAAIADAAGVRLRVEAGKLAATASCAPGDTGAAERGKAASRAAMVLSELLSRSDARAGELAKYADSARIAGLA